MLSYGCLKLHNTKQGLRAFDGLNDWRVISPYLRHKWEKRHKKIVVSVTGAYITLGHFITLFSGT